MEGLSDDNALLLLLTRIFDKNIIYVQITHGDITSDLQVNPTNIVMKITKLIKDYAVSNHYSKNDFLGVIHIVDMDGAFIGDDQIVYDKSCEHTYYTENEIYTNDISLIIDSFKKKKLKYSIFVITIVYYFSHIICIKWKSIDKFNAFFICENSRVM